VTFIQTEEGRALPNGTTDYNYEYNLRDHLGNTRVTFDTYTAGAARQVQTDDYFPFGMEILTGTASPKNEYLYNGKELQENLQWYDYGARFYDPVIARWTSVDPSAENDASYSPYIYGFNNPMRFTDPDGRWPDDGDPGVLSVTGNFAKGLGQSAWGTVTGVYGIVRHPINTATAIGTCGFLIQVKTAKAIGSAISQGYDDFQNGDANVKANIAGNVIGDVAQLFIGAGEAKAAVNSLRGVKVAEEAGQVAKVTEQVGKSSEYLNVTGTNSLRNVKTNVNATEFGANLEASGFGKTVSKDGRATTYTKDNAKYSVRQSSQTSRGTKGASADYSNGTKKPTLKIRLGEQ
jgi:RHS repeat-associated protein